MKILMVASECTPFVKTGGLADVVGTLPLALAQKGDDVRVVLPYYRDIPQYWKDQTQQLTHYYINLGWRRQYCGIRTIERENVTFYLIDNEFYFGLDNVYGSGQEEGERFGFFCRAVLEMLSHLEYRPDVIHCHDWQTGMIPALLCTQYQHIELYKGIKTVFTIHNLHYQGIFAWLHIDDLLGIGDKYFRPDMLEYFGCVSFIKAGIVFSDIVTTVSPTYAQEIQTSYYGERLDGLMRARSNVLRGILNGINPTEYDPETDMWLPNHYTADDLSGKAACKADLQREMGLKESPDTPIIAILTRLCDQKGLDLVECVLDDIMRLDVQLVVLGKGEEHYQELFSWAAWRYQGRVATRIELNNPLSHRLYAAADMVLVPSQFEPCGLTQMIAMRYGTIPIVRETGGLKDSVQPYNKYDDTGNGFSFANYNAHEMLFTIERAVGYYRDEELWELMMKRAMATDFSWGKSAEEYAKLYDELMPKDEPEELEKAPEAEPEASAEKPEAAVLTDEVKSQIAGDIADIAQAAGTVAEIVVARNVDKAVKNVRDAGKRAVKTAEKALDKADKELDKAQKRSARAKKLEENGMDNLAKAANARAKRAQNKAADTIEQAKDDIAAAAVKTIQKTAKTAASTVDKLSAVADAAVEQAQKSVRKRTAEAKPKTPKASKAQTPATDDKK